MNREIFKVKLDKIRENKGKSVKHSHKFDELNLDEIKRNKRRKRKLEINEKLLALGAADYTECHHNISMVAFYYKIEFNKIKIIEFQVADYNTKNEHMVFSIHDINKDEIKSITEDDNERGFEIITSSVCKITTKISCTGEALRNELMAVVGSFYVTKNKKRIGVVKL
jgi:hypothetical protein